MKKKGILPFVTWMDPEDMMLSETSQRKIDTMCYHLYMQSKNGELIGINRRMVVTRGRGGAGERERGKVDADQRIQTCS